MSKLFAASVMILASTVVSSVPASSADKAATTPVVSNVWAKTTVPGGRVSAAYLSIKSATPMKLLSAESNAAEHVEIHDMKMNDGVMEMKALDDVDLPAGKLVEFKPGGMHIMLVKVKQAIKVGDKVPLKLTFVGADKKRVVMNVEAIGKDGAKAAASGHQH